MELFIFILQKTILCTVPLLIVALAGIFAERSGVINIALDGMMIFGAFAGAMTVYYMQKGGVLDGHNQWQFVIAMLVAALGGAVFSLLL